MRAGFRLITDRSIIVLYIVLFVVALLLIIGTIFNWELFRTEKNSHAIHYIVDSRTEDYKNLRMLGMNAASEDLDISFFVHALKPNSDKLFNILDEHPNAIIIGDYVHGELESFIAAAKRKNIPVILTDYEMDSDEAVFIGADQMLAGTLGAEHLAPLMKEEGQVVIIGFYEDGSSGWFRAKGVKDEISAYSTLQVKANISCTESINPCMERMRELIANGKADGIIALDKRSAIEVSALIKEVNSMHTINVVAFDRTNLLLEYLQDGTIDALLVHNEFNLGYLSIQYADKLASGNSIQAIHNVKTSIITRENMFWLQNQKLLFPLND